MALTQHADHIWSISHPLRVRGLIPLGTRTTIVQLSDGSLLLHSPGPLSEQDCADIDALGTVSVLLAPNLEHFLFLADAAARWPDAQLWVAPGCPAELPRDARTLDDLDGAPWADTLDTFYVDGMPRLREFVFLHRPSKTLIITDISFNIRSRDRWWERALLSVMGAYGKLGPSTLFKSHFLQDRAAFKVSLDRVLEEDFEQIVLPHGDVVTSGGRQQLREAFAFLGT